MTKETTPAKLDKKGFTLVEILATITVVLVLAGMAGPIFRSIIQNNRFRQEVSNVESLLNRTMSESMARGAVGQITIRELTMAGQVMGLNGVWIDIGSTSLNWATFGRTDAIATPWLQSTETAASSFDDHVIPITATGVVADSGAVFLSYSGHEASVELLVSGAVVTFHREQGAAKWAK